MAATLSVRNESPFAGSAGQVVTLVPPAGVTPVAAAGPGECTVATTVVCPVPALAGGATVRIVVVLRGDAPGAATVTAILSPDDGPANDAASTGLTVVAPASTPAVALAPSSTATVVERCRVPRTRGQTLGVARLLLRAAGCTPSRVTRPKARRGRKLGRLAVASTNPAAGQVRPRGTRVALRLREIRSSRR